MKVIEPNSRFTLYFKMSLDDGTEVESNFGEEPVEFSIGDNSLTPGMEDALMDKATGDTISVMLSPELAFGLPDENNIHSMPAEDFPNDMPPKINQVIAFDGPDNSEIMGTIVNISKDEVHVDFSHPLAGRMIKFNAEIVSIL